jgi:hypothetical protein
MIFISRILMESSTGISVTSWDVDGSNTIHITRTVDDGNVFYGENANNRPI